MFLFLRPKSLENVLHLPLTKQFIQLYIKIWCAEVPVVFGYFVFQNQVVPPGIPGQFTDHAMVLVQVMPVVGKDHIGRDVVLQLFEVRLNFRSTVGEKSIPKILNDNLFPLRGA